MGKINEKVWISRKGRSVIFTMGIRNHYWMVWPALIVFPRGSGDGLGGGTPARDVTLSWLRFGITFRWE